MLSILVGRSLKYGRFYEQPARLGSLNGIAIPSIVRSSGGTDYTAQGLVASNLSTTSLFIKFLVYFDNLR